MKGPGVHYFNNSSTSDERLASLSHYKIIVIENCIKRKQQFHEKFDWKAEIKNLIYDFIKKNVYVCGCAGTSATFTGT